jgi:cytochrome c-type biogenesis protein CcmH
MSMILFWIICAIMLIIALLFIVIPLWRGKNKSKAVDREVANLEIIRGQVVEMDADLRNGLLTQEMYEQGTQELQNRVLNEVGEVPVEQTVLLNNRPKILALILTIILPVTAIVLYWNIGNHHALLMQDSVATADGFNVVGSPEALKELESKLSKNPNDPEGLLLLARSYGELERFADSAQVYDSLTQLAPNEAQIWADYADVLAMASGKTLVGNPTKLLDKALALDPDNFKALALAGSAAMERGDFKQTIQHWERLSKLIPPQDENAILIENGIQQARLLLAQKNGAKSPRIDQNTAAPESVQNQTAATGKEAISGLVALSSALKAQTSPTDTVFVLVRAAEGPKMPLAIVRKQVKDLPFNFTLDDTTSMSPQMKVSSFNQVVVVARVSKSGNAISQPGDLLGTSETVKPGATNVKLTIDKVVP